VNRLRRTTACRRLHEPRFDLCFARAGTEANEIAQCATTGIEPRERTLEAKRTDTVGRRECRLREIHNAIE